MRRIQLISFSVILLYIFSPVCISAQVVGQGSSQLGLAKGRPQGSYQISDIESINYFNGRLNITLPITSTQGRGGNSLPVNVSFNSPGWSTFVDEVDDQTGHGTTRPGLFAEYEPIGEVFGSKVLGSFDVRARMKVGYVDYSTCFNDPFYQHALTRIYVTTPDGTEYELRDTLTDGQVMSMNVCYVYRNRGRTFVSKDGTNVKFVADSDIYDNGWTDFPPGVLYLPDGTTYNYGGGTPESLIQDRNGNLTNFGFVLENGKYLHKGTDSIGRVTTIQPYYSNHNFEPETGFIKYKGFDGQNREVSIVGSLMSNALIAGQTIKTKSQLFPSLPNYGTGSSAIDPFVISQVVLPNGQSYHFKYNSYGELARIEFPTGAVVEYVWANGVEGAESSGMIIWREEDSYIYRRVVERRIYADGVNLTSSMTISRPEYMSGYNINNTGYVDVKTFAPQLISFERHYYYGQTTSTFSTLINNYNYSSWKTGREYQTEIFSSQDSSLLRRTTQSWQQTSPNWCNSQNCNSDDAPVNNPKVIETTTLLADSNQVSKKTFSYDTQNNLTDTYEYDYGTGAPGSFLRRIHTDYLTVNPVNNIDYTSNGVYNLNLPSETWVSSDSSGNNKVSLTKFEYDNYASDANHALLTDRQNVIGHDSNIGTNYTARGNVTAVTSYENAQNITVYLQYDILGNVVKTIDAKENVSTIDYTDRFGSPNGEAQSNTLPTQLNGQNTFAFPTSATNAMGWITGYSQVDYFTGQSVDMEDLNGVVSSTFYNDPLDRPTQSISANNLSAFKRQTNIIYDDANRRVEIKSDLNDFNDNLLKSESFYDGLGRTIESRKYEQDGGYVATKSLPFAVIQDSETNIWRAAMKASNPYRPLANEQPVWTTALSDELGRAIKTITPDGAMVKTAYSGNAVTVTDQAGKQRRSITNALGQLTRVDEPNDAGQLGDISSPIQPTNYSYDTLNNLITVNQGVQTRTFVYDSLSRLKSATNPESGTISYSYDNNGNLTTKTDARGVITNYVYDALNRVTQRSYAAPTNPANYEATPTVNYTYENTSVTSLKGVMTKVTNGFSTTEYQVFDTLGRVTQSQQMTDGTIYGEPMTYTYNLSGAMIEQKYPSGRVVKNVLDTDGDLSIVQSKKNQNAGYFNYAKSFTYTAAGAVTSMQLGNGKWESTQFNSRLQPTQIALGTVQNGTDKLKLDFEYGTLNTGTGQVINGTNNGNVAKQTITVPTETRNNVTYGSFSATQYYVYDSLNRIQIASENLTPNGQSTYQSWMQTYQYDRYGNRNFDEANTTTLPKNCGTSPNWTVCPADVPVVNPSVNQTNNRLNGYTFDNAGNTTKDAQSRKFTYDGENKQTKVETVDANGNPTGTIGEYFYDGDGKRVKKYVPSTGETTVFVYNAGGQLVAEYSTQIIQTPQVSYLTTDHLGSPRINTDQNGQVTARHDYQPFGEEIQRASYGADAVRKQFTSYERDDESELDFAQARYYNPKHGRFTTTDPIFFDMERIIDPQQLNIYIYVVNNPLKYIDPTGLDIEINGDERQWAFDEFSKGLSFKTALSDKNKVVVLDKGGKQLDNEKDKKALNKMLKGMKDGPEKELFKAIIDTKNHGVLTANTRDDDVDIGETKGVGKNSVDRGEVEMLAKHEKDGGFSASDVVRHEAMEAYLSAKSGKPVYVPGGVPGKDYDSDSHFKNPFPGLTSTTLPRSSGNTVFQDVTILPGSKAKGSYTLKKEFNKGESKKGKITAVLYFPF